MFYLPLSYHHDVDLNNNFVKQSAPAAAVNGPVVQFARYLT